MQTSLMVAALWMGLAGGPHCVAMCGAACAGIAQAGGKQGGAALWLFQLGRVVGYALLGGLAAASMQGFGWLTVHSAALRPVWSLLHVAAIALGVVLVVYARQPIWLESMGRKVWQRVRSWGRIQGRGLPLILGVLWALLPCGLLYSALLVAAMAADPYQGAAVMALFAVGTSITMLAGPWLWLRVFKSRLGDGAWGVRLAGAALAGSAGWALWMGLVHQAAPWCIT